MSKPPAPSRPAQKQTAKKAVKRKKVAVAKERAVATQPGQAEDPLAGISRLLNFEKKLLATQTQADTLFLLVNDLHRLVECTHAIYIEDIGTGRPRVRQVSNLNTIDRTAPMVSWFEKLARQWPGIADSDQLQEISRLKLMEEMRRDWSDLSVGRLLWIPLPKPNGEAASVLILSRSSAWQVGEKQLLEHVRQLISHKLFCQAGSLRNRLLKKRPSMLALIIILTLFVASFIPVRLSVLAPAEISAASPVLLTAPFDGVVAEIPIRPGQSVKNGQLLVQMEDSQLKNQRDTLREALAVARAQLHKTRQAVFSDTSLKSRVAELEASVDLKQVELDYAEQQLRETVLRARTDGIAIIDHPEQWRGKPVRVGERLLQLADPGQVEVSIHVPVKDSIALQDEAEVRVFLDTDPLTPLPASIKHAAYEPAPGPDNSPAYRVTAALSGEGEVPRIGLRGTAKIYGDEVSLFYYLFRRPVTSLRQWLGW